MSELRYERYAEKPSYLAIDTAERSELEIGQLLEKNVRREELMAYEERDERTAYLVQATLVALEIAPDTPELFADGEERWKLDPAQRETALHALKVERAVGVARRTLLEAQMRLSRVEFGDFMMDVLDDVERSKSDTDLYRAFRLLQTMSIDRSDLVPAHRIALVMLHDTINDN